MHKRPGFWVLLLAVGVLAAVLAVLATYQREPEYAGKRLREWVYCRQRVNGVFFSPSATSIEFTNAIRHMGNQAVPFLLKWIQDDPPFWRERLIPMANRVLSRINRSWILSESERTNRGNRAMFALIALGPEAGDAVQRLALLSTNPKAKIGGRRATIVLHGFWHPSAAEVRIASRKARDPDAIIWPTRTNDPQAGFCALKDLLQSADPRIRTAATSALRKLDPAELQRGKP